MVVSVSQWLIGGNTYYLVFYDHSTLSALRQFPYFRAALSCRYYTIHAYSPLFPMNKQLASILLYYN